MGTLIAKIYECRNCYHSDILFTRGRPSCRLCRDRAYILKMHIVGWIQWNPLVRIPWDLQWNVVDVVVEKRELQNNVMRVLQVILIPCSNVRKDVVSNSHGHPWSVWVIYVEILKGFNLPYRRPSLRIVDGRRQCSFGGGAMPAHGEACMFVQKRTQPVGTTLCCHLRWKGKEDEMVCRHTYRILLRECGRNLFQGWR